jgi:hypothetical protein
MEQEFLDLLIVLGISDLGIVLGIVVIVGIVAPVSIIWLGVCPRNQVDLVSVGTMLYMRFNRKRISSVAVIGFTDGQEVSEVDSGSAVAVAAVASRMAC